MKRNGIPGPSPNWILGNSSEVKKKGMSICFQEWQQLYGDVVGYYIGGIPQVAIMDVDLVKQIEVKDFGNFVSRNHLLKGGIFGSIMGTSNVFFAEEDTWHGIRNIVNSSFTPKNLKDYASIIKVCVEEKMDHLTAMANSEIDMFSEWESFTMAAGVRALLGFSTDTDLVKNFWKLLKALIMSDFTENFGIVYVLFPELASIFYPIRRWLSGFKDRLQWTTLGKVLAVLTPMVKVRRQNKGGCQKDKHFLQRLVNDQNLTDDEVVSNCYIVILAAQDTSASALAFATQILVHDQGLQEELRVEIRQLIDQDGELNENVLLNLPKVSSLIYETMRLFPTAPLAVTRRASCDYRYKTPSGHRLTIPAECGIVVGAHALHRDARHWDRPEEFDLTRFDNGVKNIKEPFAYQAFGHGPRQCAGRRFALIAMKLAICELLMKFKLLPSSKTERAITTAEYYFTLAPAHGVTVNLIPLETSGLTDEL